MSRFLRHQLWPAIAILIAMTFITGVAYPALVTAVAQVALKEIWLIWLAKSGESGRWAWLVAVTADDASAAALAA